VKVAVVSDIHANRQAFEAVLEAVEAAGAEELWCLGDLVGYGAEPNECVALARRYAAHCLAGNHDLAVVGAISIEEFSRGANLAVRWTREVLTTDNLQYLETLKPQAVVGEFGLYHASPRDPIWEYVLSSLLAELCMDVQEQRIGLIGHSHVALSFWRFDGQPATGQTQKAGSEIDLQQGRWLINPGSVGQPRDGDPRAAWLLLDTDRKVATYNRTPYDIAGAAKAIRAAHLPDSLAERLEYGQ